MAASNIAASVSIVRPVVIIPTGSIGPTSIAQLRKAGYLVVHAADPGAVKMFAPDESAAAVNRAYRAAFERALGNWDSGTKGVLLTFLFDALRKEKLLP